MVYLKYDISTKAPAYTVVDSLGSTDLCFHFHKLWHIFLLKQTGRCLSTKSGDHRNTGEDFFPVNLTEYNQSIISHHLLSSFELLTNKGERGHIHCSNGNIMLSKW